VFPDHWSFLLGEIAFYSFIILLITGTLLAIWFQPSMTDVIYRGGYLPLRGVRMSEAYASTLNISFDVRGGLLLRQVHHWASDLFLAAIMGHMIKVFLTGTYRKPRRGNWLIGIALFSLAIVEGLFGNYLPDDLLSGTGLRVMDGILLAVPLVGSYLAFFLFGGSFPGHDIIGRLYVLHVLVIPALMLALLAGHLAVTFWQQHTPAPGRGPAGHRIGVPAYPHFMARTGAVFFFTFAATALAATLAQINPIWLYGPFNPANASAGSGPEFYLGMIEGAVRLMPGWSWQIFGHTVPWNVLIPAVVLPGLFFTAAAAWPFLETWITGDRARHHQPDPLRAAPARTGIGMAVITFWGILWAEGADDIIGRYLDVPFELITEIARLGIFIGPAAAYLATKRICLRLQHDDLRLLAHGAETGVIRRLPSGRYVAERKPLAGPARALVEWRTSAALAASRPDSPRPDSGRRLASGGPAAGRSRVRERLRRALTEGVQPTATSGRGPSDAEVYLAGPRPNHSPQEVDAIAAGRDRSDRGRPG
jgi:ubiquinol-cytochrome c reductase cytochrome b subunit